MLFAVINDFCLSPSLYCEVPKRKTVFCFFLHQICICLWNFLCRALCWHSVRSTLNHEHDRESRSLEQNTKLAIKGNEYRKWKTNMQVKIPSRRSTQQTWKLKWNTMTMHTLPKKGLSEQDKQIQSLISVGTPWRTAGVSVVRANLQEGKWEMYYATNKWVKEVRALYANFWVCRKKIMLIGVLRLCFYLGLGKTSKRSVLGSIH